MNKRHWIICIKLFFFFFNILKFVLRIKSKHLRNDYLIIIIVIKYFSTSTIFVYAADIVVVFVVVIWWIEEVGEWKIIIIHNKIQKKKKTKKKKLVMTWIDHTAPYSVCMVNINRCRRTAKNNPKSSICLDLKCGKWYCFRHRTSSYILQQIFSINCDWVDHAFVMSSAIRMEQLAIRKNNNNQNRSTIDAMINDEPLRFCARFDFYQSRKRKAGSWFFCQWWVDNNNIVQYQVLYCNFWKEREREREIKRFSPFNNHWIKIA